MRHRFAAINAEIDLHARPMSHKRPCTYPHVHTPMHRRVRIHAHPPGHKHAHTHAHKHARMHACKYARHARVYSHAHTHARSRTHTHARMHAHAHVRARTHMPTRVRAHTHAHMQATGPGGAALSLPLSDAVLFGPAGLGELESGARWGVRRQGRPEPMLKV